MFALCLAAFVLLAPCAFAQEAAAPEAPAPQSTPGDSAVPGANLEVPEEIQALQASLEVEEKAVEVLVAFKDEQDAAMAANEEQVRQLLMSGVAEGVDALKQDTARRWHLLRMAFELGLDRYPNNAQFHNYYGEVLYDGFGDQVVALKHWNQAIGLDSKLALPYNNLGLHYAHLGEYKRCLEYMDKALELSPDNADILYNMVQLYLIHGPQMAELRDWEKGRVYKEAMKMSKKAVKELPEDYELRQDYAVNFWKAEEFGVDAKWTDAAEAWQEARTLAKGTNQVFYTWLNEARAWLQAEKFDKAEACAAEAIKILPESTPAKTVLARAREGATARKD